MENPIDLTSTDGWRSIEAELPEDFEELAKEHKVLEVQYGDAKITSASDLLKLILLHAGVDLGLRQTVALVAESGGPSVSHVTLHKKMRLSAPYLRTLVGRLAKEEEEATPERWAGYEVVIVDGSTFCGPGAETTDARAHLQMRLADLEVLGVVIADRSVGETFKRFAWREGQLAVGDRGYCNPPGIAHVVDQGADVLVRVNRGTLPLATPAGEPVALLEWLRGLRGHAVHEHAVKVHVQEGNRGIHGRVVAMRLPAAQAEKSRARARRELGAKATPIDMEMAQYVVVFTTAPASRMSAVMCLTLYRLRWQVELAFKRWKSLCHFDRLPNYRDDTILSWLYAKLLLALLMHRMSSGASALFPPVQEEPEPTMALFAVEGGQHHVARHCRSAAAA
jgi:Transposase DDE domain